MRRRFPAALIALCAISCTIPLDRRTAAEIPQELAVSKLSEMLPKAWYVKCREPGISFDQSEIQAWSVTNEGLQFQPARRDPFRLSWSDSRGAELVKFPSRYEVRVFAAVPGDARRNLYILNWKEEAEARRAAELLESLRGDR